MDTWLADYAHRRYGIANPNLNKAWQVLNNTVYGKKIGPPYQQGTNESIFCARPSLNITSVSSWATTELHYNPVELLEAWQLFIQESDGLADRTNFQYDLVDLTRQVLANYAQVIYADMVRHYKNGDLSGFNRASEKFTTLLKDQDRLLNSRKEFMLGLWLEAAKSRATNPAEKDLFEYNARTQITTWSFQDSNLHDYAHREWGGMLSDFYLPRWELFIAKLKAELNGEHSKDIDYYAFEEGWNNEHKLFPTTEQGDGVAIAKALYATYIQDIKAAYQ
nr:alpha-N-acetylglucosaminidase C-terminal domain-containing protein [Gelidibacter sediminis]